MAHRYSVLLITDALALPAAAVLWTMRTFEDKVDAGNRLVIVTQALMPGSLKLEPSSLDVVVSLAENAGFHSFSWLVELAKLLKPGGQIVVQEPQTAESLTKAALDRNLLLAGYINSEVSEMIAQELNLNAARDTASSFVTIKAQKPMWETGMSYSIRKKFPEEEESLKGNGRILRLSVEELREVSMSNGSAALNLPVFSGEDDLIDEDSLLTEADLRKPELPRVDDCEIGKAGRKACKNCTCGLAEMEKGSSLTDEQFNNPKSACGNCGLGDAFRCGSCPYKGLPPFKLGEKVTLSGTLLTADV